MEERAIDQEWADERGGLHDVKITQVIVRDGDLLISVDDEWANEAGLDGYSGKRPGTICLQGLKAVPRVDEMVLKELISDVFIEGGGTIRLTIICFGQHKLEAVGNRISWRNVGD